jgi:hypothetical protein
LHDRESAIELIAVRDQTVFGRRLSAGRLG